MNDKEIERLIVLIEMGFIIGWDGGKGVRLSQKIRFCAGTPRLVFFNGEYIDLFATDPDDINVFTSFANWRKAAIAKAEGDNDD